MLDHLLPPELSFTVLWLPALVVAITLICLLGTQELSSRLSNASMLLTHMLYTSFQHPFLILCTLTSAGSVPNGEILSSSGEYMIKNAAGRHRNETLYRWLVRRPSTHILLEFKCVTCACVCVSSLVAPISSRLGIKFREHNVHKWTITLHSMCVNTQIHAHTSPPQTLCSKERKKHIKKFNLPSYAAKRGI